ncbi:MAG: hypothetical protein GC156_16160 [Actinomycetales bacterium]|nr:hypothetical protein [Actinomycetales bacterium]
MSTEPDPFDSVEFDEEFVSGGVREPTAEERAARLRRIAAANDRLRAEGEISDGSGKPRFHAMRRSAPWIAVGAIVGITIIVVVLIAR